MSPSRRRRLTALAGLGLLLASAGSGCRKRGARPPAETGLRLLTPGAAPRVTLRYGFRPGLVVHYRLVSEQALVGARRPPERQRRHLSYAVDRVRRHQAQVRWRVEADPAAAPGAPPGPALWLQLDDRGAVQAVSASRGSGPTDPALRQTLVSFYPRFPAAALGRGGRWQETRRMTWRPVVGLPPFEAVLRARYTVERFAACGRTRCAEISARVSMELSHRMGERRLRGEGTGRGHVHFDLGRGVIVSATSLSELGLRVESTGARVAEIFRLRQELEEIRAPLRLPRSPRRATPAPTGRPSASGSAPPAAPRGR